MLNKEDVFAQLKKAAILADFSTVELAYEYFFVYKCSLTDYYIDYKNIIKVTRSFVDTFEDLKNKNNTGLLKKHIDNFVYTSALQQFWVDIFPKKEDEKSIDAKMLRFFISEVKRYQLELSQLVGAEKS